MKAAKHRLKRIEVQARFKHWVRVQRIFETMTADELEAFAVSGTWIDRPEPPFGTSRFDSMDHASLIRIWREREGKFEGRDSNELEFYAIHGSWPLSTIHF
jgi:hypothetical protein